MAKRCVVCHSANDAIPLTKYDEVRPWAVSIKEQVLNRSMPPWGAVKGFGNLAGDEALSQEEVMIIANWVIGGAPEGSKLLLPGPLIGSVSHATQITRIGIPVVNERALRKSLVLTALRPEPSGERVESAQIVAQLPDGEILPLLWLYQYEKKWDRTFRFRSPLRLPAGTSVRSSAPLTFRLEGK